VPRRLHVVPSSAYGFSSRFKGKLGNPEELIARHKPPRFRALSRDRDRLRYGQ
jgi:hypothetical protein